MMKKGRKKLNKKRSLEIKKLLRLEILISILVLIGVLILLVKIFSPPQPSLVGNYLPPGAGNQYNCTSCENCRNLIAVSVAGDYINLNTSISATENCIVFSEVDDIAFDCNWNSIMSAGGEGINYGILLNNSHNNTIRNCNVSAFMAEDIYILDSDNNTIENMILTDTVGGSGFYLLGTLNNILRNITASGNSDYGIHVHDTDFTWIESSNLLNNNYGIYFYDTINSTLTKTNISSNTYGIYIEADFDYNIINSSRIENNSAAGFHLEDSPNFASYNTFYDNIFNNTLNKDPFRAENFFNTTNHSGANIRNGPYIGGNYWGNWSNSSIGFSDNCTDSNENGYCDATYAVDLNNNDYLPLSNITFAPTDSTAPYVTINSPTNTTYMTSTITMNVTATDAGSSVSSCWYTLNSGTTNITLTNTAGDYYTASHASLSNQLYTAQFYCNDTSNNMNNTESVSFTVSVTDTNGDNEDTGGGSSSSSSSTLSTTQESFLFNEISPTSPAEIFFNNNNLNINKITIKTNKIVKDTSITVTSISSLPEANRNIGIPEGISCNGFSVTFLGFTNEDIDNVTIEFEVNKSWMEEQEGTPEQISLFRKPDQANQWNQLPTDYLSEDDDYYYFSATSPGFSEFTIFLLSKFYCSTPGERRCNGNITQLCLANYEWRNIKLCNMGCVEGECNEEPLSVRLQDFLSKISSTTPGLIALLVLIFIISLSIIIVFYLIIQQKYKNIKILKKV